MKLRRVLLLLCLVAYVVTPLSAGPKKKGNHDRDRDDEPGSISALVTGTVRSGQTQTPPEVFTGVLKITNFVSQNGGLMAVGTLSGAVTGATGDVIQNIQDQAVALRVIGVDPTCGILSLHLGPLTMNLLGLQIDLNDTILTIVGQTGAGNLLGNLICAVAGLLDGGFTAGLLGNLAALLNQILAVLGTL